VCARARVYVRLRVCICACVRECICVCDYPRHHTPLSAAVDVISIFISEQSALQCLN